MTPAAILDLVVCPKCRLPLTAHSENFSCSAGCETVYPIYAQVPVLIDPANPAFPPIDFADGRPPDIFFKQHQHPLLRFLKRLRPDVTLNRASQKNYTGLAQSLPANAKVLIVGGSIDGQGIHALKQGLPPGALLVETDVAHGPNTRVIMDVHQIPFPDNSFDLVVAQAVLEHVLDPFLAVQEIYRVLKPGGMVYAETPFMQQVHGGRHDFHRFTPLGHRRLFKHFEETKSGLVAGPGSMFAWSLLYFITSFAPNKKADKALGFAGSFLAFGFKYFDYLFGESKAAYDSACGVYFWGTKTPGFCLSDQALLQQYKGQKS